MRNAQHLTIIRVVTDLLGYQ